MHKLIIGSSLLIMALGGTVVVQAKKVPKQEVPPVEAKIADGSGKCASTAAHVGGGGGSGKCHVQDLSVSKKLKGKVKSKSKDKLKKNKSVKKTSSDLKLEGIDGES